jgi:hypothetical protein
MAKASEKLSAQQQRFNILYNADKAAKELRPEHRAELERLTAAGFAPTVTAVSQDTIAANIRQAVNMRTKVDRALGNVGGTTTGLGGAILGNIPGSSGRDLRGDIDTLKANLTFDELKKLKAASPTGASGLGALSDTEGRLLASTVANLDPGQSEDRLRENLQQVAEHYDAWVKSLGYSDDQIKQAAGGVNPFVAPTEPPPSVGGSDPGAPQSAPSAPTNPSSPAPLAPDSLTISNGGTHTEADPELAGLNKQVAGMVAAGASAKAIRSYLVSAGVDPTGVRGIDEAVEFRRKNPGYKGGYSVQIGVRDVPESAARSALSSIAGSPMGAYGMKAADTLLLGGLDELAPGNANLNRLGIDAVTATNPTASALGTGTGIIGNVATALGGEGALARAGIRYAAPLADTLFGGVSGALSNNDNRLTGALTGGVAGLGGGALGRSVISGLGKAVAPTGGKLGPLYDAGVRPTIGQRFVGTGILGNAANGVEEALQSVPLAGFAVRGARQKARDQFERGAFNSALGEIGHKLPDDIELGTAPHAFMQSKFSEAYDNVLPNMRAVKDADFEDAAQRILDNVSSGGLSDDSANRFNKIINAQVVRRFGDAGEMSGDDLKQATSAIGKQIQNLRSSPQGDRELASALEDYLGELKSSAMRNSDPGAAAALDAIDRGYAKAVRIEDAASARGGDTGRFSPAQFDRYVQKDSGGIRSRAYLRGDALFGDYAEAGKSLADRLPNSGTADRLLATQALGGAPVLSALGYASPASAALVGAATLPYAPIARDVVGAALAPRQSQTLRTLGDYIRQRAQLGGALGTVALPDFVASQ